jgi:hypothetical protein
MAIAAVGTAAACARADRPGAGPNDAPVVDTPIVVIDAPPKLDAMHEIDAHEIDAAVPDAAAATCTTAITCATAMELPGIGGDETGASTSGSTGYQATWLQIRVSETDSGPLADPMSMQATLTSPASQAFDLAIYVPGNATSTNCSTPTGTVTTSGSTQTWSLEWGETGTFANDVDDSRTIAIEISPQSPDGCAPADTWSLSIVTGFD